MTVWHAPYKEALLLGSSLPTSYQLGCLYKYRYAIESLFRDCQSLGFHWEANQVRKLDHAQKVVLGMRWVVLRAIVLGQQVAEEELQGRPSGKRRLRPPQARFSLVYLGLERLQSYLVGKVHKPLVWQLAHFQADFRLSEERLMVTRELSAVETMATLVHHGWLAEVHRTYGALGSWVERNN